MAKLMPSVYLALWVIVYVTVTVHCEDCCPYCPHCTEPIEAIQAKPAGQRTDEEWARLSQTAAYELSRYGLKFRVISQETDCTEKYRNILANFLASCRIEYKKHVALATEYFALYLETCGYDERFRKAIDNIDQNLDIPLNLNEHSTVNSYLEAEFWRRSPKGLSDVKNNLNEALTAITEFSKLERISRETNCTEKLLANLVKWLQQFKVYPKFHELVSDYFGLYLSTCGYEENFKKMIDSTKQKVAEPWNLVAFPTLYSYYAKELSKMIGLDKDRMKHAVFLLSSMEKVSEIDQNSSKEATCTMELMTKSLQARVSKLDSWAHRFVKPYFALYLDKCGFEQSFNRGIEYINQSSHEWNSDMNPTLYSCFEVIISTEMVKEEANEVFHALNPTMLVIRELAARDGMDNEADCSRSLEENLFTWLDISSRSESQMNKLAKGYFGLYLDSCGFEKSFKKAIDNIKPTPHAHWDSSKCSTLDNCLEVDYWPQMQSNKRASQEKLDIILSIIMQLSALEHISKETHCNEVLESNLIKWLPESQVYPNFYELVFDYFSLYLDTCGLEEVFKKAVENVEQMSHEPWNTANFPTLYSYFRRKFSAGGSITELKLIRPLLVIREVSAFESSSELPDCSEEMQTKLVRWLENSKVYFPELFKPIRDYFVLYLDTCGFEERFKEGMTRRKIPIGESKSPLATYIFYKSNIKFRRPEDFAKQVKFLLDVVNRMPVLGQFDASNCNREFSDSLEKQFKSARSERLIKFKGYLDTVFEDYLKVCSNNFKTMAKNFVDNNQEIWAFIEKAANLMEGLLMKYPVTSRKYALVHQEIIEQVSVEMSGGEWDGYRDDDKFSEFLQTFRDNCKAAWYVMYPSIYGISHNRKLFEDDEDSVNFLKHLSTCASEMKEIPQDILKMFKDMGFPYYP